MMQTVDHQGQMPTGGANIIVTSSGEIATADNPNVAGERIVLQPNQRLIIVDPVTGQQKQIQLVQVAPSSSQTAPQHHIMITTQTLPSQQADQQPLPQDTHSRRLAFGADDYFVDHHAQSTSAAPQSGHHAALANAQNAQPPHSPTAAPHLAVYAATTPTLLETSAQYEAEQARKAKLAEAARQRYHRLDPDQKKALNKKRTIAQKRKRQRAKEMAELDEILRQSGDIVDDPDVLEQLRERRIRARWAEAARARYHRMSEEQRRAHNNRRRMRQMLVKNESGENMNDEEVVRDKVNEKNQRKAEAARLRYHRMSQDEKKQYNRRRTEAFRKRRMEEERLLSMPVGQINEEALDRAQRVVIRNAKRAEAARLRYHRMTADERRNYNQRRYTPKSKHEPTIIDDGGGRAPVVIVKEESAKRRALNFDEFDDDDDEDEEIADETSRVNSAQAFSDERLDALMSIEQEISRQTKQAQQALKHRNGGAAASKSNSNSGSEN